MLTNHYSKVRPGTRGNPTPSSLLAAIGKFLQTCSRPAMLEYGADAIPLHPEQHEVQMRNGQLYISAWPDNRSLTRRIIGIEAEKPGLLVCIVQRFGGATGRLNLLDLAHPRSSGRLKRGDRGNFAEEFRRMLNRQFPGWEVRSLSSEMSLAQSFSPVYPRALLQRGSGRIAAMACPGVEDEHGLLSFALLWHDHVCGGAANHDRVPLALFLPEHTGSITALRLKWLRISAKIFLFNADGSAGEVDTADLGNMSTKVAARRQSAHLPSTLQSLLSELRAKYNIEIVDEPGGGSSLRCSGLEFGHLRDGRLFVGMDEKHLCADGESGSIEALACQLSAIRGAGKANQQHPLYRAHQELWLESAVRQNLGAVDAALEHQPLLSQVITFAGGDRDIIDLLSASGEGRIAVLELKVSEDIHLPLQALDYWMRADWHLKAGELDIFFSDIRLSRRSPRLLLIAPGVRFHSSNETVLSYFAKDIETERVGLNLEWQQGLKVVFRLRGCEKPQSQRSSP
jgi:hypothetical protein